jgi:hypothetical protein
MSAPAAAQSLSHTILRHGLSPAALVFFAAVLGVLCLFAGLGMQAKSRWVRIIFRLLTVLLGVAAIGCLGGWAWMSLT